ncbi:enhanced intracellular survival protein Eis [Sphaerimonospora cavernae]|uniref:Enhanced intracellular survival protein Eis n=1 Tax=Sphaerimonospora cavernae TaxID=1740611 RepID=A0ABV6U654_9ACTN
MEIRELSPGDLDAVLDNRKRAFGPISARDAEIWREMVTPMLPEGRYLGVFDGPRLTATARVNPYTQWWHGRPVSMGGVASVTVAPEDRGRGVGGRLMRAVIDRCAELGHAVSALYPATTPIYRGLGWEHAGAQFIATLPAEALRTLRGGHGDVKLRRMGPDDAGELRAVLSRVHAATRACGPLVQDERTWRLWLAGEDDFCYLADDGYVIYRWSGGDIRVDNLVAGSEATARALWSLVGTASSIAESVKACVEPYDPVLWLLRERSHDEVTQTRWMLRVIDLPAAVEARGYPPGVSVDAVIEVEDPQRPANAGVWRLCVEAGSGSVERLGGTAPAAAARFTIGGMSALFAGVPAATLRRTGRLAGGSPETDSALDAVFNCSPYMIDYF